MKPASLSARITALLVVTSLLVLGGGAALMDWRIDHEMESRFQQYLLTRASALSSMTQLEQGVVPGGHRSTPAGVLGGDSHAYYELRCDGEAPQRSTPPPPVIPPGWAEAADAKPTFAQWRHRGQQLSSVQFTFFLTAEADPEDIREHPAWPAGAPRQCRLLFEQDRQAIEQILLAIDWILLLGPLLALCIALVAVPLIVRRGLRPMAMLVEQMRGIGPHAPGQRVAASGLHELDPLVARFNDVLERMDEGLARERQFASGLAHETRTRLAELRALTEVESRYPSGRSLPDVFAELGLIGAELEATVTALLLLTRLQSGVEEPQLQWLLLEPWLERQQQRCADMAANRDICLLRTATDRDVSLHTDPALLQVVVGNLLGNACTYAPQGDTVRWCLHATSISLENAAPGLDATDLPNLGRRFWRKQVPHAGHAGLGLALASAAAGALELTLAFRLDQGRLHVTVAWPAGMARRT